MRKGMNFLAIAFLSFMHACASGSQSSAHQSGQSLAASLLGGVGTAAKLTSLGDIPGFKTDHPKEADLDKHSLSEEARLESKRSEASQHLLAQAKDRKSFKIDPSTDPLFVDAHEAIENPEKTLKEDFEEEKIESKEAKDELINCEEGGEEYIQRCQKRLVIEFKIIPAHKIISPYCPGHYELSSPISRTYAYRGHCAGCRHREVDVPEKVELIREEWVDDCLHLEELTEKGLCRYVSLTKSPQNETRTIQGQRVTRDHFEEQCEYACFKAPQSSCSGLREKGCYQINSVCKETIADKCVLWGQTYRCPSKKLVRGKSYKSTNKSNPFCLSGNCADSSYEANDEMMNVMSQMSVLREAQNDLRNYKVIFRGVDRRCTRNCVNFRDCCGSGKGWGLSLHLSSCDDAEKELRKLRDKNLCLEVGTYCAERVPILKTCIRKKTTFCCFGTKLARLIHQYGRAQLGIGFGDPEGPNCAGLSAEQLAQIDFSRINFSELYEDIQSQMVVKDQSQSLETLSKERLQSNMTLLTKPSISLEAQQDLEKLRKKGL